MQPGFALTPALEEGFLPLQSFSRPLPPVPKEPYPRLYVLLSFFLERHTAAQSHACVPFCPSLDARRDLALIRRVEARQAASLSRFLPTDPLKRTLDGALLTLELSSSLAQRMEDTPVRRALQFLIPEYLDTLYRLCQMYLLETGEDPAGHLSFYAEIMPGRPLIACHRHPYDGVFPPPEALNVGEEMALRMLLAAESGFQGQLLSLPESACPGLREEIYLAQEGRLSLLSSLLPERMGLSLLHFLHYIECYLYASWEAQCESHDLKPIFREEGEHERAHLKKLAALMAAAELPPPALPGFPPPLCLGPNKGFVRDTLQQIGVTMQRASFVPVGTLPRGADFFRYQKRVCPNPSLVPSHRAVEKVIAKTGADYRYEIAPHPVEVMRQRDQDPTDLGR